MCPGDNRDTTRRQVARESAFEKELTTMDFSLFHMWQQMGCVAKAVVAILLVMSSTRSAWWSSAGSRSARGAIQSLGYVAAIQQRIANKTPISELVGIDRKWRGSPIARIIGFGARRIRARRRRAGTRPPTAREEVELVVDDVSPVDEPRQGARAGELEDAAWRRWPPSRRRRPSSGCSARCSASSPPSRTWPIPARAAAVAWRRCPPASRRRC